MYCAVTCESHDQDAPPISLQGGERVVFVQLSLSSAHPSDPPDVPSLGDASETLRRLVDSGALTVSSTYSPPPSLSAYIIRLLYMPLVHLRLLAVDQRELS